MKQTITLFLILILTITVAWQHEVRGQASAGGGPSFSAATVSAAFPGNPADGHIYRRPSDHKLFTFSATFDRWIGVPEVWALGRNTADYNGFINIGAGNTQSDTTTDAEVGWRADATMRLMKVSGNSTSAANSTTYVFADQTVVVKLVWDADSSGQQTWTPTADSSGAWIAPAARVAMSPGDILSAAYVDSAGPSPTEPSGSHMAFYFSEEVTP